MEKKYKYIIRWYPVEPNDNLEVQNIEGGVRVDNPQNVQDLIDLYRVQVNGLHGHGLDAKDGDILFCNNQTWLMTEAKNAKKALDIFFAKIKEHYERHNDSAEKTNNANTDPINNPEHYTYGRIECIDAMIDTQDITAVIGFCKCNAFKYLWRHKHKNGVQDLEKADWYLRKAIELMKKDYVGGKE